MDNLFRFMSRIESPLDRPSSSNSVGAGASITPVQPTRFHVQHEDRVRHDHAIEASPPVFISPTLPEEP